MRVTKLMAAARLRAVGLLMATSCAAGCTRAPTASFGSGLAAVPASRAIAEQERAMVVRLNRDRAKQGLPALGLDPRLSDIARHHSADMRDHRFFEHESPRTGTLENRLDAAGYLFLAARENLSEAPDVELSQDSLLASPPHHTNIMASDITHVGVGIVVGGVEDPRNLTVTQVFATPLAEEPPARALSRIFERVRQERAAAGLPPARRDTQLSELAERHIEDLDATGSSTSIERAGQSIGDALDGKRAARLSISAQVVPSSAQLALPAPLTTAPSCALGLAARRVHGGKGRPALQVLLIVLEAAPPAR